MAFVIPTAHFQSPNINIPGPTHYNPHHNYSIKPSLVPFNQSAPKLNNQIHQGPGPADYQKVSINQVYNHQKNPTNIFKSKVQRFKNNNNSVIGPGSYYIENKITNSEPKKNINLKSKSSKSPFIRVIYRNPNSTENFLSQYVPRDFLNKSVGPGDYNPKKGNTNKISGWSKSKAKRFQNNVKQNQLGPTSYQIQNVTRTNNKISAPFISNVVKSYFDNLIYKTNNQQLAHIRRQNLKYKDNDPGPGHYQPKLLKKRVNSTHQFFGTTTIRAFSPDIVRNSQVGPGTYDPVYPQQSKKIQRKSNKRRVASCISEHRNKQNRQIQGEIKKSGPGPGYYENNNKTLKQQLFNKFKLGINGQFGIREQRFKTQHTKNHNNKIGPGYYELNQIIKDIKGPSFSHSKRQNINNSNTPFLNYNLDIYDISKSAQKKKQFIQNLQKIQVYRPAFQSKVQRFKTQKVEYPSNVKLNVARENQNDQSYRKNLECGYPFQSKVKRFQEDQRNIIPAPGIYYKQNQLQKASYNIKYGYRKIIQKC